MGDRENLDRKKEEKMSATEDNIEEKILKPIGKKVEFKFPNNEGRKEGYLKDRAFIESNPGSSDVPYWDVIDLIEFPDEPEPIWLRIGYYRKPKDRLVWGSQTTITEPIATWKRLLIHVAREKEWFRELLVEVMNELR
jgi:hypothetical protein